MRGLTGVRSRLLSSPLSVAVPVAGFIRWVVQHACAIASYTVCANSTRKQLQRFTEPPNANQRRQLRYNDSDGRTGRSNGLARSLAHLQRIHGAPDLADKLRRVFDTPEDSAPVDVDLALYRGFAGDDVLTAFSL